MHAHLRNIFLKIKVGNASAPFRSLVMLPKSGKQTVSELLVTNTVALKDTQASAIIMPNIITYIFASL